jgi:hypothetical protein
VPATIAEKVVELGFAGVSGLMKTSFLCDKFADVTDGVATPYPLRGLGLLIY